MHLIHHTPTMYERLTFTQLCNQPIFKDVLLIRITINTTELVCTSTGQVFRKMKSGSWKEVQNKRNHNKGYNVILIDKKQYTRAKLILYALHKINLEDKHTNIYHINGDRLDCSIKNLTYQVPPKQAIV